MSRREPAGPPRKRNQTGPGIERLEQDAGGGVAGRFLQDTSEQGQRVRARIKGEISHKRHKRILLCLLWLFPPPISCPNAERRFRCSDSDTQRPGNRRTAAILTVPVAAETAGPSRAGTDTPSRYRK